MAEGLPPDLREIVIAAIDEAMQCGAATVEAAHLLLALTTRRGPVVDVLAEVGLDHDGVLRALRIERDASLRYAGVEPVGDDRLVSTPSRSRPRFGTSAREALAVGHRMQSTESSLRTRPSRGGGRGRRRSAVGIVALGILHAELGTMPRMLELAGIDRRTLAVRIRALGP